jgi:hypothetical protein
VAGLSPHPQPQINKTANPWAGGFFIYLKVKVFDFRFPCYQKSVLAVVAAEQ